MSNPIILPNLSFINEFDPISGGPPILNANFADLSGYATGVRAGLIQLTEFGDVLLPVPSQQLAVAPAHLNEKLANTSDITPSVGGLYNLGSAGMLYKALYLSEKLNLGNSDLTISGGVIYVDGQSVALSADFDPVDLHTLEDNTVHSNILGSPTSNGQTFIYNNGNWQFGFPGNINPNNTPSNGDYLAWNAASGMYVDDNNPIKKDGSVGYSGNQSMAGNRITDLDTDINNYSNYDAVPKAYVDQNVIPPGSIQLSFSNVMPGYLSCIGGEYPVSGYPALYDAIGNAYGGVSGITFRVPDTRGMFFRSQDLSAGVDPDAATRIARPDGLSGDVIGSTQLDEVASVGSGLALSGGGALPAPTSNGTTPINIDGGAETRPININVRTYIKT
tara:strand:- start:1178 stop:2347 length:1170 start_codon:yes stop_codon:yes gene_type:complete